MAADEHESVAADDRTGTHRDATDAPPARLAWVDAARGYSVAAVVLAHVVLWQLASTPLPVHHLGASVWADVYGILGSVRMPVLLAVSGLVLSRRVRAGWRDGGLALRAGRNYYLYVVWLVLYAVFYALVPEPGLPHRVDGVTDVLRQLVVPGTTLWYVYALAVYIVVLGLLARVLPGPAVLALAAVVSVAVHAGVHTEEAWVKVPELVFFFAAGVHGAGLLRRVADRASLWLVGLAAVAAAVVTLGGRLVGGSAVAGSVLFLARGTVWLVLAVAVVAYAVRWSPVRRVGVALGRQTLPVYVVHPLLIALVVVACGGPAREIAEAVLAHPVGALLYPPLLAALILLACIGVRRLAVVARVDVPLFEMPKAWSRRLDTHITRSHD